MKCEPGDIGHQNCARPEYFFREHFGVYSVTLVSVKLYATSLQQVTAVRGIPE